MLIKVDAINKIVVVAEKEFRDNISDHKFIMSFVMLMLLTIGSTITAVDTYHESILEDVNVGENISIYKMELFRSLNDVMTMFGSIIAASISFNTFSKEERNSSLKVVLSYPIFRDQILVGKILSGIVTSAVVVFSSSLIGYSIIIMAGMTITFDLLMRMFMVFLVSILYLATYIGITTMLSLMFKEDSTALIAVLLIISLSGSYQMQTMRNVAGYALFGSDLNIIEVEDGTFTFKMPTEAGKKFVKFMSKIDIDHCYYVINSQLFMPTYLISINGYYMSTPSTVWDMVRETSGYTLTQCLIMTGSFIVSYIQFRKMEIT